MSSGRLSGGLMSGGLMSAHHSVLLSSNELITNIGQLASCSAKSPIGSNIAYFRHRYGIYLDQSLNANLASLRN